MEQEMLAYAIRYAKSGIGVFPIWEPFGSVCTCGNPDCGSPAKHPIETLVPHGCLDATTNEETIRKWWSKHPTANIGISCGKTLFVVDIDPKHGGSESFKVLVEKNGQLPACASVNTGGGGKHYYLKVNGTPIKGRIGLRPGIDIKSTGGYVVAPPSKHVSGKRYEFVPGKAPIADPPDWLVKLINEEEKKKGKFDVELALKGAPKGKRYYLLIGFAGKLREGDIPFDAALKLMMECAANCTPPAPEQDTKRILEKAYATWKPSDKPPHPAYSEAPPDWDSPVEQNPSQSPPEIKTLSQITTEYIDKIKTNGRTKYVTTGIASLDYAIGGGIDYGEMAIVAARPSHGKSAFALFLLDASAKAGITTAIVSEEMSGMMLGKRTVQLSTDIAEYQWQSKMDLVENEVDKHFADRQPCYVLERCKTSERTVEAISYLVKNKGVTVVAVDYAQLLGSRGNSRYEQVTQTSIALRQLANSTKIALVVLCQLNREISMREKFIPRLDDLKDSGQLEQDADVVISLVWPWYLDNGKAKNEYQVWINKNRNREILCPMVQCRFDPSRQMFSVNMNERINGLF